MKTIVLPPPQLENSWKKCLADEWQKKYLHDLAEFISDERKQAAVYPPPSLVFNAFQTTSFNDVKVVIIGQDPYHGPNQAHGLSFSVPEGVNPPPSLKNIFKELQTDLGISMPQKNGCLVPWAQQGVLLLNAILTVREGCPGSHHNKGWEAFTDAVVQKLCERDDPVIFVLWGKFAQEKCKAILQLTTQRHFVLSAPHPSPYSAHSGFLGCRHFSKINELLARQNKSPLDWRLPLA